MMRLGDGSHAIMNGVGTGNAQVLAAKPTNKTTCDDVRFNYTLQRICPFPFFQIC
ncbi:hypothetical protein QNH26_05645 [Peribacillus frigoritolerans]|uniref:hypothetical protein n=1 Tax=Peribacillus frigoritolerans TaxID=450367 RepID=UPI0024C1DD7F|nr:hypothetical protein [Peribacillus frigoritolerans]WHX68086.1 hypothetical protein QNH26_05645 [Peribacillus frigoritolerans]